MEGEIASEAARENVRRSEWACKVGLFRPPTAATDAGNTTIKDHGQKSTLRLVAKLDEKENGTLLRHCAEDAKECHRFELQKLIEHQPSA